MNKIISLTLVCCTVLLCGCREEPSTASLEQDRTEKNQRTLLENQPPVSLDFSLERENINKRTKLWNDPNKVSYIYLINYGKIMAFHTLKGKVSSVNSQVTNPQQLTGRYIERAGGDSYVTGNLPSPSEDGSYGTNGDAIFFFTTNNDYIEWKGDYMLASSPLKLSTPPVVTIVENAND